MFERCLKVIKQVNEPHKASPSRKISSLSWIILTEFLQVETSMVRRCWTLPLASAGQYVDQPPLTGWMIRLQSDIADLQSWSLWAVRSRCQQGPNRGYGDWFQTNWSVYIAWSVNQIKRQCAASKEVKNETSTAQIAIWNYLFPGIAGLCYATDCYRPLSLYSLVHYLRTVVHHTHQHNQCFLHLELLDC